MEIITIGIENLEIVKLVNEKLSTVLQASFAAEKRWTASCWTYEAPSA